MIDPRRVAGTPSSAHALAAALAAAALLAHPGGAAALSYGAGFDYQTGPSAHSARSALLFASEERDRADLTVAAIAYDDSRAGRGFSGTGNAGVGFGPITRVRVVVIGSAGEDRYRAWQVRGGPEISLGQAAIAGCYYLRLGDSASSKLNGVGAELETPLLGDLSGRLGASYGRWNTGAESLQASAGTTWVAGSRVRVLGELVIGRNVAPTAGTAQSGGVTRLPIVGDLGGGPSDTTEGAGDSDIVVAGVVGLRFVIP